MSIELERKKERKERRARRKRLRGPRAPADVRERDAGSGASLSAPRSPENLDGRTSKSGEQA